MRIVRCLLMQQIGHPQGSRCSTRKRDALKKKKTRGSLGSASPRKEGGRRSGGGDGRNEDGSEESPEKGGKRKKRRDRGEGRGGDDARKDADNGSEGANQLAALRRDDLGYYKKRGRSRIEVCDFARQ